MMQAALDNQHILAAVRERKPPAIGDRALGGSFELGDQPRRQVHTFKVRETQSLQSYQAISAPQNSSTISARAAILPREAIQAGGNF